MTLQQYTAFIRLFGCNGRKYVMEMKDGFQIALRKKAKLYVQKAVERGEYDGGYILIRLPSVGDASIVQEVEQWCFSCLERDGFYFAHLWQSDIETVKRMELGELSCKEG